MPGEESILLTSSELIKLDKKQFVFLFSPSYKRVLFKKEEIIIWPIENPHFKKFRIAYVVFFFFFS